MYRKRRPIGKNTEINNKMEGDNKTRRLQIHTRTMEKYNPSRALRAEQKRIEVELWKKRRNKLLWKRMENNSRETEEELERKRIP